MSKYNWEQMEICKKCQFRDKKNPDICYSKGYAEEKPAPMNTLNDCGRGVMDSMWQRMPEEAKQNYRTNNNF